MRRKVSGETEETTSSVYTLNSSHAVLCNNSSVTAVAMHQGHDCEDGVVRRIIKRLCEDSQHGPHRYEAVSVNHNTVFAAFHFILFK
jgi:hypothetical protein